MDHANESQRHKAENRTADRMQQKLVAYTCRLTYETLPDEVIHAATLRVVDTLGALMAGLDGDACQRARRIALRVTDDAGATVIGTRSKASPELAAFANATASRYAEANDVYRWPRSTGGHPSDVIAPLIAAAEHVQANGRELIAGVVLAYEIYCRLSDTMDAWGNGVEPANFASIGVAAAAANLFRLSPLQVSHAISMAAVSGNLLRQVRTGHLSAWKAVAAGEAGRAGVFAALLARDGMEGPELPFEGKHGWCARLAGRPLELGAMAGDAGAEFKVGVTLIKPRTACAATIASILAAEKISLAKVEAVDRVAVEVYGNAKRGMGTGEHLWNPDSRETADHSIPYVVAAALLDGTVTPRSFDDQRRSDPVLRALLPKIEVVENAEFSAAYQRFPTEHRARVTVTTAEGARYVGEAGGSADDLSDPKSDAEISDKFLLLAGEALGRQRAERILETLWRLKAVPNVAKLPPQFTVG